MKDYRKKIIEKINDEFNKVECLDAPVEKDFNCGSCTGDRRYNKNYSSVIFSAGRFDSVNNSCQSYFLEDGEKIETLTLSKKELLDLYHKIVSAVKIAIAEEEKINNEIEKL